MGEYVLLACCDVELLGECLREGKKMIFKQIRSGGDRNFSYLIASDKTGEGTVIDPSPEPDKVFGEIDKEIEIKYIFNTHFHYDHSGGNDYFASVYRDKNITFINSEDRGSPKDGEMFSVGRPSFTA